MRSAARRVYQWFEYPHRFAAVRERLQTPGGRVLDVGCGNHSPALTKSYFPNIVYHGIDRETPWNLDEADDRAMDAFFRLDLDRGGALGVLPDRSYDVVFCSHVLEHLHDPIAVAEGLAKKMAPGGVLFIEMPSRRSLSLPRTADGWRGVRGCLNYHDDPTHRTFVDLSAVRSRLRDAGYAVSPARPRRMLRRIALLPVYCAAGLVMRGYVPASVLWDVVGFAQWITVTGLRHTADQTPDAPARGSRAVV